MMLMADDVNGLQDTEKAHMFGTRNSHIILFEVHHW